MAEFTYATYLRATPEDVWRALTDPDWTVRYWMGLRFETTWETGATMVWRMPGVAIDHPDQVVVGATPGEELAYTWHTFTPEWAAASDVDEATRATFDAEPRSTARFNLDRELTVTRLTLTHTGFDEASVVLAAVREGWPPILSSLKSLLETGEPLAWG
ncbi:MAG: SRPBCC family protein [Acidimicrobiales bacterium]